MIARALVLLVLMLAGCGVRGDPIPPSQVERDRSEEAEQAE
ncbi:MAG: lipoprotein [Pseudomonadota bacterium]